MATLTRGVSTCSENWDVAASQTLRRDSAALRAKSRAVLVDARACLDRANQALRRSQKVCEHVTALRTNRRSGAANRKK